MSLACTDISQVARRFGRANEGAVAVEFALASIPFLLLTIGIIEIALMYASATVLEGGTIAASRIIRTGQAQQSADPEATFVTNLCQQVRNILDCSRLQYEVLQPAGNSFNDADGLEPQFDASGQLITNGFDAGGVSDIVVIRTAYRYRFVTPFIAPLLSNALDSGITLVSTVTLRSEPYEFEN